MDDIGERPTNSNLRPFRRGDPRAVEAGRKGGLARSARAASSIERGREAATQLETLRATFNRATLGDDAAVIGQLILARIASGEIKVRGEDAAALLRAVHEIARLEAGQATSHALVGHVSQADSVARVVELQRQARAVLDAGRVIDVSAAVSAADDGEPPEVVEVVRVDVDTPLS